MVEQAVKAVTPGGVSLKGTMDRLDPRPDGLGYDVLDYKTGNPERAKAKLKAAPYNPHATLADWHRDEKKRGGAYWRQAVFYQLLLKYDAQKRFPPSSVSFDFIQPRKKPGHPPEHVRTQVAIGLNDEVTVLAQIDAVNAAIRAHEFDQGCGKCAWCKLRSRV